MKNVWPNRSLVNGLAFVALCVASVSVSRADTPIVSALLGNWVGPGLDKVRAPSGAEAYLRRSVRFTPDLETLRIEAFADEKGTIRLFTYESDGPYKVIGPSSDIVGAYEIDLTNDRSLMTIHIADPGLWKGLNLGACPLAVGKAVEISACASGPPFNTSSCIDRDLVQIDAAGALRFGDQASNRCEKRPTTLDRAHYIKAQN
ncbi:MAG: hypothetical protein O9330_04765 [Beijerinckiaceae bacterium]|nr:hypothetical protein [Beijerinckiaceae bacterium]